MPLAEDTPPPSPSTDKLRPPVRPHTPSTGISFGILFHFALSDTHILKLIFALDDVATESYLEQMLPSPPPRSGTPSSFVARYDSILDGPDSKRRSMNPLSDSPNMARKTPLMDGAHKTIGKTPAEAKNSFYDTLTPIKVKLQFEEKPIEEELLYTMMIGFSFF